MKFVLNKAKWLRGNANTSTLLDHSGCQCCVGQLLSQFGVDADALLEIGTAEAAGEEVPWALSWLLGDDDDTDGHGYTCDSMVARALYEINDDLALTDDERIARMRPILARHGIELEVMEGT